MPEICHCKEEEKLYRDALSEAAKEKDEAVRLHCIELVHSMHKEIERTFLLKACEHCPYRQ